MTTPQSAIATPAMPTTRNMISFTLYFSFRLNTVATAAAKRPITISTIPAGTSLVFSGVSGSSSSSAIFASEVICESLSSMWLYSFLTLWMFAIFFCISSRPSSDGTPSLNIPESVSKYCSSSGVKLRLSSTAFKLSSSPACFVFSKSSASSGALSPKTAIAAL